MNLILGPRYSDDGRILPQAAAARGWQVVRLRSSAAPADLDGSACRIYAEGLLAEHLAEQLGLELLRPAHDLLPRLEPESIRRQIGFATAATFERPDEPAFIKPADQKLFAAGIYAPSDPIPGLEHLAPEDPILISEPVVFTREYRFFVRHERIATGSIYLAGDEIPEVAIGCGGDGDPVWNDAWGFAQRVCDRTDGEAPWSFVIDVGLLDFGVWAVVEFNPTWASGIYGSDPAAVLDCLEYSQVPTHAGTTE